MSAGKFHNKTILIILDQFSSGMGTYLCRQANQRQQIKSKHLHELFKSTNINLLKQNNLTLSNKNYFPCEYLGRGVYGTTVEVFLKQKKQERYAQKITKIEWIRREFLFLDTPLFQQFNHSTYFVHTFSIRNQGRKLYVVNQKLGLGNMYTFMKRHHKFIEYGVLKQLSIRIVLILEKLHAKNIIYRSLRPQNILFVDHNGDFKLSELYFSIVGETAQSYTGAAVYTPPEIFAEGGTFDKSIDFWMLGVLIYELIVGHTPFQGQNLSQIKENIMNFHSDSLKFPEQMHICQDLNEFVSNLLQPDPSIRIGINQIKRHKFFHGETLDEYRGEKSFLSIKQNHQRQESVAPNRTVYSRTEKNQSFVPDFTELIYDEKCILKSI